MGLGLGIGCRGGGGGADVDREVTNLLLQVIDHLVVSGRWIDLLHPCVYATAYSPERNGSSPASSEFVRTSGLSGVDIWAVPRQADLTYAIRIQHPHVSRHHIALSGPQRTIEGGCYAVRPHESGGAALGRKTREFTRVLVSVSHL